MKADRIRLVGAALTLLALSSSGCPRPGGESAGREDTAMTTVMTIRITSPAFAAGQAIPVRHTCDGEDLSPALEWSGVPASAKSLVLICDDPDAPAGTWSHWVLYGLPPTVTGLPEGAGTTPPGGARQGRNDFRRAGYGGPCPPPGKPHRYSFRLSALDTELALGPDATRAEVLRAMEGHVLAQGELMGTYQRKR